MARRYDTRTTIFSPEGRLFQVEYAMEAISHAGTCVGVLSKEGIVLAAEKKVTSKLLESKGSSEKMYRLDNHVAASVAGLTADANIVVNYARLTAQRYLIQYGQPTPIEQLVQTVCDLKQGYTQFGGLRPFGVSFLYAGWDQHLGFQLYKSDPSGNYGGWMATSIGAGHQTATSILKSDYKEDGTLKDALILAIKVLSKTMDSTVLDHEKLEFGTLTLVDGRVVWKLLEGPVLDSLIKEADLKAADKDAAKKSADDLNKAAKALKSRLSDSKPSTAEMKSVVAQATTLQSFVATHPVALASAGATAVKTALAKIEQSFGMPAR